MKIKTRNNPEHYFVLTYTDRTGKPIVIYNEYITRLYKDRLDWLVNDGYKFNKTYHKGVYTKVYTQHDLMVLPNHPQMHRLPNGTYFAIDRDVRLCSKRLNEMLTLYGCTKIHLRDSVTDKDII